MRCTLRPTLLVAAIAALSLPLWAERARADGPGAEADGLPGAAARDAAVPSHHYEPTGLSLLRPYRRGRVPVLLIHGLWGTPYQWARLVNAIEADPKLEGRCQVWTFGYSTGDPIPYSAHLLRQSLSEARRRFDPDRSDRAFDRMVLVGHSMGGLLAKMMAQDSGSKLWTLVSPHPIEALAGPAEDRELLRQALFYERIPEVRRIVFIATPHRGSRIDHGPVRVLGSRLVRLPDPLLRLHKGLIAVNGADFFSPVFRNGLPTSVDQLAWEHPLLMTLGDLEIDRAVARHSIIADLRDPPLPGGSDGVVPYDSSHVQGVASERLVSSSHNCLERPAVIGETCRILREHLDPLPAGAGRGERGAGLPGVAARSGSAATP